MPITECTECGELHHTHTPCRSGDEILADYALPADYADRERARRIAARDRMDAIMLGR